MANLFMTPAKMIVGKNSLQECGNVLKKLGSKAFIVTDNMMVSTGNVKKVTDILAEHKIQFEVFSEINSEPTDMMVYQGVERYAETGCDFLIALGGGSPIDAMKAIGAISVNNGLLADYMGKDIPLCPPPLVAIPTTAGTGSEATQFTIISDTKNNVKMLLKGQSLLPSLAIIDPEMTISVPPKVTAATGIDALAHAVEAYTSKKAQALSDTFAVSACKRIFANLRKAFTDGWDIEARQQMSLAALEAGIAFNNSSVTLVHGMSRPIGALFHVPHGVSNAMLMGECLGFAAEGAPDRFAQLAHELGFGVPGEPATQTAKHLVEEIVKLCEALQIPSPDKFGIDKDSFFRNIDKMAEDALTSGSPSNTLRDITKSDIIKIYTKLWQ